MQIFDQGIRYFDALIVFGPRTVVLVTSGRGEDVEKCEEEASQA